MKKKDAANVRSLQLRVAKLERDSHMQTAIIYWLRKLAERSYYDQFGSTDFSWTPDSLPRGPVKPSIGFTDVTKSLRTTPPAHLLVPSLERMYNIILLNGAC